MITYQLLKLRNIYLNWFVCDTSVIIGKDPKPEQAGSKVLSILYGDTFVILISMLLIYDELLKITKPSKKNF